MGRFHAHAFRAQCGLWRASLAEPRKRGKRADAGGCAAQPVRLCRTWGAIYIGVAGSGADGRSDRGFAGKGAANGREARAGKIDAAISCLRVISAGC